MNSENENTLCEHLNSNINNVNEVSGNVMSVDIDDNIYNDNTCNVNIGVNNSSGTVNDERCDANFTTAVCPGYIKS